MRFVVDRYARSVYEEVTLTDATLCPMHMKGAERPSYGGQAKSLV
jgi:hypothetical protein